ncbi:MAG: hypothetical protein ABIK89_23795, partial [Planctomycetota bacterium]
FLNGQEIGTRVAPTRWHEPLVVDLGPGSEAHRHVRFGQDNVIALQLSGFVDRTTRLDEVDPQRARVQAMRLYWPTHFEQYVTVGDRPRTPQLEPAPLQDQCNADRGQIVFELAAVAPKVSARVTYSWDATEPVLRKTVEVVNHDDHEVRLLNVRLGSYQTGGQVSEGGQGFPVYLDGQFFFSLAHPSGWAMGQEGQVRLRHFPGATLAPGERFSCMETVLGVAEAGQARRRFLAHVRGRSRRVVRGHDRPYAIIDNFGSWSLEGEQGTGGMFARNTERALLHSLQRLSESQKLVGRVFDLHSVDFWHDVQGDMTRFAPQDFPNGFAPIRREMKKLGIEPGLWIASGFGGWATVNAEFAGCCRAQEPLHSQYATAFRHHIRENGIRLAKFDCLDAICYNPNHDHLPGVYSTEAIHNAVIETLRDLDEENPDVFLMLYWGHRSPWWIVHGDTIFEPSLFIEAAHPGPSPTLYARDSVTQCLDQAHWFCEDVPRLGKESLGIWLSDWWWNSSIGKHRWQEGFVMDICRGSLLAQPWANWEWLSPGESKQMADFVALLKAQPACFANPRFVLGNPWKDEPYGYCCSDGQRAFIALNNGVWKDTEVCLKLSPAWGLPDGGRWDLYRWYPQPARVQGDGEPFGEEVSIWMRPFEVMLLEVVPAGQAASLDRALDVQPLPARFAEPSRSVAVATRLASSEEEAALQPAWEVLEPESMVSAGGATLAKQQDGSILASGVNSSPDTCTITTTTEQTWITAIRVEALTDPSLPVQGPGRAFNGNFALNELRVTAEPLDHSAAAASVTLSNPAANFSQNTQPVAAAIDGNEKTGWSVHPQQGHRHAAVFQVEKPLGFPGGTKLTFTLVQGYPDGHNLGRLRLAVTAAEPPVPVPAGYGLRPLLVTGHVPPCADGGTLVVSAQITRGSAALAWRNIGSYFHVQGRLAGQTIACQPVLGRATYEAPWQAWRIAVEPSGDPQPFELSITATLPADVELDWKGHCIPN